jgi:hypothetical protein
MADKGNFDRFAKHVMTMVRPGKARSKDDRAKIREMRFKSYRVKEKGRRRDELVREARAEYERERASRTLAVTPEEDREST